MLPNNALYPQSVEELLTWPYHGQVIKDRCGTFYTFTGFEGQGVCYWCGGELPKKATRWCRANYGTAQAHWLLYHEHFDWNYAVSWCWSRYDHRCGNCGKEGKLEVHHIVPVNGDRHQYSLYHVPWNLIALCHACHLAVHAAMRPPKPPSPTKVEELIAAGQLVLI